MNTLRLPKPIDQIMVKTPEDARRKLGALVRWVVKRSGRKNIEISQAIPSISESSLSRLVNAVGKIDEDKLVELLDYFEVPSDYIRNCVMLATAINAEGRPSSAHLLSACKWIFTPPEVLDNSQTRFAPLLDFLSDQPGIDDGKLEQLNGILLDGLSEAEGSSVEDLTLGIATVLRSQSATERLPQELVRLLKELSFGDIQAILRQNEQVLTFNQFFAKRPPEVWGRHTKAVRWQCPYFDFWHIETPPDTPLADNSHEGIHFIILLKGSGEFAQWKKGTRPKERYLNSIRLNDRKRLIVFNAATMKPDGKHCFRSGPNGAEVLVVLLEPKWSSQMSARQRTVGASDD